MTSLAKSLSEFLADRPNAALVEVASAKGSTPREKGAWMLVARDRIFGTIGGGQLEYMAIDQARQMLCSSLPATPPHPASASLGHPLPAGERRFAGRRAIGSPRSSRGATLTTSSPRRGEGGRAKRRPGEGAVVATLDIPLGPEIGQCCGGRVEIAIQLVDKNLREQLLRDAEAEDRSRPHVYVFGGGHVGRTLASALSLLPIKIIVVETRAEELKGLPAGVETLLTAVPEDAVHAAPDGSAFLILTHDHALDFLIVAEALKREDAAYVGMIGSKTKKATFRSWYLKNAGGTPAAFERLVSPIGGDSIKDKRPAVIASLAAAEVMTALARTHISAKQFA